MKAADLGNPPERVMLDTNVLLSATDQARTEHADALCVVSQWPARGTTLFLSGQILREYLAVATRPVVSRGLGLAGPDALANARAFRDRAVLLPEDGDVASRLLNLLADTSSTGKIVHDANVVATMLTHRIDALVTSNVKDFARFSPYITPIRL